MIPINSEGNMLFNSPSVEFAEERTSSTTTENENDTFETYKQNEDGKKLTEFISRKDLIEVYSRNCFSTKGKGPEKVRHGLEIMVMRILKIMENYMGYTYKKLIREATDSNNDQTLSGRAVVLITDGHPFPSDQTVSQSDRNEALIGMVLVWKSF